MNDNLDLKFIEYNGGIKTKGFIADLSDTISAGASGKYGITFTSDINLYASYKGTYLSWNTPFIILWHSKVDDNNLCTGEYVSSNMLKFDVDGVYSFLSLIPVSDTQVSLGSETSPWQDVYANRFIATNKTSEDLLLGDGSTIAKTNLLGNYYTKSEADAIHSSVVKMMGNVSIAHSNEYDYFAMTPTEIGLAYICNISGSYAENVAGLDGHDVEVGDVLICVGWENGDKLLPKYTVIQSNWTAYVYNNTLSWGKSVNLASVGGKVIKATLPAEPPKFTSLTLTGDVAGSGTSSDNKTLSLSTSILDASKTQRGLVNTGDLTFAGNKTFEGQIIVNHSTHPQIYSNVGNTLTLACDSTQTKGSVVIVEGCFRKNAATGSMDLGSSLYKWNNVYATTFNGDLDGKANKVNCIQANTDRTRPLVGWSSDDNQLYYTENTIINWATGAITAPKFIVKNKTASDILLGDGSTITKSALLTGSLNNYLPLAGGTMTGTITFNISDDSKPWIDFGRASIERVGQEGMLLYADGAELKLELDTITANCQVSASAFYETSDARKKDIKSDLSLDKCYDLIDKCQTVIYTLKDQTQEQIGMIAQEIEEFFPEVVATDADGFKSLAYDRLVVICFKVLKDVIKRLEKLER